MSLLKQKILLGGVAGLIVFVTSDVMAMPSPTTTATSVSSASQATKSKSKTTKRHRVKKRAPTTKLDPTAYIKKQSLQDLKQPSTIQAVRSIEGIQVAQEVQQSTNAAGSTAAGNAPVDCDPAPNPQELAAADATRESTEQQKAQGSREGSDGPSTIAMAKSLFAEARERCRPTGRSGPKLKPAFGLTVEDPQGGDKEKGSVAPKSIQDVSQRVGASVGISAEF